MRICVDLRRKFDCGVGRVAYNVAVILNRIKNNFDFKIILLVTKDTIIDTRAHFKDIDTILTDADFFSYTDMFELPKILENDIDVFWSSQFYLSPFFNCPVITTIHDLWPVKYPEWLPNHDEVKKKHGKDVINVAEKIVHYFELNMLPELQRVNEIYDNKIDILNRFMLACMHLSARQAKIIVTPSLYSLREIKEYFPEYSEKVNLLYPIVNTSCLPKKFDNQVDRIMMVAKFDPRKNHKFVISSLPILFSLYSKLNKVVEIFFIGEIGYRSFGKQLVKLGKSIEKEPHKIIFTDSVSERDLWYYYSICDLLIIPSLDEGFGLPLMEGLGSDVICLASNKGSLPEVGNKYAYYTDIKNPEIFAKEMFSILSDKEAARKKVKGGKEYIQTKFSIENAEIQAANILKKRFGNNL